MSSKYRHKVVCFGEILWDILPTGTVPGGAPMNVAYHLKKPGNEPALITRIGNDDWGKKLMELIRQNDLTCDFFQRDCTLETGKVYAKPNEHNEVAYDIIEPVAWDFIEWEDSFEEVTKNSEFFVFGSLAARNSVSKETLFRLLEIAKNKVLDINLRSPHFNKRIVEELLQKADFLKLNLAELELITGWFSDYTNINDRIKSLRDRFSISNMVVTKGDAGAVLYINGDIKNHPGIKINVVDTIGSGDAFLAGLLSKLIEEKMHEEALEFASGLGAFIATQRGACPVYEIEEIGKLIYNQNVAV